MATEFTPAFPPKGRKETGLGIIEMRLTDSLSAVIVDPNKLAFIGYRRKLPVTQPLGVSAISGEPGYLFETDEGISVMLSEAELIRLARRDLLPAEYFALRDMFGVFHEIHDDFYEETSGMALQPMEN